MEHPKIASALRGVLLAGIAGWAMAAPVSAGAYSGNGGHRSTSTGQTPNGKGSGKCATKSRSGKRSGSHSLSKGGSRGRNSVTRSEVKAMRVSGSGQEQTQSPSQNGFGTASAMAKLGN